jgi:hypothetical protein
MKGSAEYTIEVVAQQQGSVVLSPGNPDAATDLGTFDVGVEITPVEITASGGQSPYLFSISSGALPDGIQAVSDNVDTLQLSGTPTTEGAADFVITATDSTGAPAKTSARFVGKVK